MNQALEFVVHCGAGGLTLAVLAALVAAPLALLALVVDRTAGRWFSARVRCWLWVLVAVRLLLPIAPASPISAVQLWRGVGWTEPSSPVGPSLHAGSPAAAEYLVVPASMDDAPAAPAGTRQSMAQVLAEGRASLLPELAEVAQRWRRLWSGEGASPGGAVSGVLSWDRETIVIAGLVCVWMAGALLVLLRATIASARFAWRLRRIDVVSDPATIDTVLRACDQIGVRAPGVKLVAGLPVPSLFGLWRPTLCLPDDANTSLDQDQLRMIALHEAMHIRRGDAWLAWLLTVVRAVHWFNPVAWYTVSRVEAYRELACDDGVRRLTRPQDRAVYAGLLLRFASGRPGAGLGLLGLCFARPARTLSARALAARIAAAASMDDNRRRLPWPASGALLVLAAVVGLTDVAAVGAASAPEPPVLPIFPAGEASAWDVLQARAATDAASDDPDPIETHEYDLTEALSKVDDVPPSISAKDWLLLWARQGAGQAPDIRPIEPLPVEGKPNTFCITMTRSGRRFFEAMLAEVCRVGHVGQVVVTTRMMTSEQVAALIDKDWMGTVKYAAPEPADPPEWEESAPQDVTPQEGGAGFSVSMESVSFEYAPYTAFIVDGTKMDKLVDYFQGNPRASIRNAPKVTLFSGQSAMICDESFTPFVLGVDRIKGKYATAFHPNIAVLPEGLKLNVQTTLLDDDSVELRCRLTLSSIDGVKLAKLFGEDVTVQNPTATRRTVDVRCRLQRGETLLVAPLTTPQGGGTKSQYYAISAEGLAADPRP